MKLNQYMPLFLQDIREFKAIFNSEDKELEYLNNLVATMLIEVIVNTAESYGLTRYEKIYGITDIATTVDERRFNILTKMNNKVPFTYNWLRNKLKTLVGEGNYEIIEDFKHYKIQIDIIALFDDIAIILNKDLRQQLPANLQIIVNLFQTEQCNIYYGGIVHIGDNLEIRQVI